MHGIKQIVLLVLALSLFSTLVSTVEATAAPAKPRLTMAVSGSGTTSPSAGTYTYNKITVVDIKATPESGWEFVNWTGNVADPNSANTTVTVDRNMRVTANFTRITHNLVIAISGNGTASPSAGIHSYNDGTVVNITAIPDSGWQFNSWSGDVANPNSASTSVTVDGDKTVTAIFSVVNHDLTIAVSGSGATSPSAGIHSYNDGTVINISAIPDSGWQFNNWSGDVANPNSATTTVTIDDNKIITANFTEIAEVTYNLTMDAIGNGTTSPPAGTRTYNAGMVVNISATPDSGWEFVSWTGNVADPNSASTIVTMSDNRMVTANFSQIAGTTYDLTMAAIGNGAISPSPGTRTYDAGTVVNISATPDSGWMFFKWAGDVADSNSASTTVTMDGNKTITANFSQIAEITYVITISTDGNGITSPSLGSHRYNEDALVDISATPDSGWMFDSWSGEVDDPDSASTTVIVDGDKTLTAIFSQINQSGEAGGCSCGSNGSVISVNELLLGWGIIGACWGGGYYAVTRSGKRKI